jgi:hypothetical protein
MKISTTNDYKNYSWKKIAILNNKIPTSYLGFLSGLLLCVIVIYVITNFIFSEPIEFRFYKKLYLILIIIPVHEMLHFVALPDYKSGKLGFSFRTLSFFTLSDVTFSRDRFIFISLIPLIILTILPFILLYFFKYEWIVYILIYNLAGSGMDILYSLKALSLPKQTKIKFIGGEMYTYTLTTSH